MTSCFDIHDYRRHILLTCARNDAAVCDVTVGQRGGGRLLSAAIFTQPILYVQYHSDEGKIEGGDSRLMRLEERKEYHTAMYLAVWYHTSSSKVVMAGESVGTYLGGVPIIKGMFCHQVVESIDGGWGCGDIPGNSTYCPRCLSPSGCRGWWW